MVDKWWHNDYVSVIGWGTCDKVSVRKQSKCGKNDGGKGKTMKMIGKWSEK